MKTKDLLMGLGFGLAGSGLLGNKMQNLGPLGGILGMYLAGKKKKNPMTGMEEEEEDEFGAPPTMGGGGGLGGMMGGLGGAMGGSPYGLFGRGMGGRF